MTPSNLDRMIHLADEFFDARNDPDQLSVDESVIGRLRAIHPASVTEQCDENGPIAWFIVIPTTHEIMYEFINKSINEKELLDRTPLNATYDALYLCSALVLPEHRNKGIARQTVSGAIAAISKDHPIATLFYWAWSVEGGRLATFLADERRLLLLKRQM
jgi:hypothetical protein